jgi:uncharacterized membrane protein
MLVLGFTGDAFAERILPELGRLQELDAVRLLDLLVVRKTDAGELEVERIGALDGEEAKRFGELVGALAGVEPDDPTERSYAALAGAAELDETGALDDAPVWYLGDAIPAGTAAAVVLIEHGWAIPLRDAIIDAGAFALADEWIHPADLLAVREATRRVTSPGPQSGLSAKRT